ncbi:hypothetical protein PVAND_002860 [Polypedilum vanderplanki]|uniref:Uncharacterized protein n=1 Tax=Polypedilum vanderplanki TaxID=319348 RepID=A0A9J6BTF0_POLVA|nr:hypothetical protein PVAND_002860 [Polypedilum vanderplanki]
MNERKKHNQIDDLKIRLINDKKFSKKFRPTAIASTKVEDNNVPPYIRKYNRRFKSIYETMHKNPYVEDEKMRQYERNFRLEKKKHNNDGNTVYGYFEKYKKIDDDDDQYRTNEIPESEILNKNSYYTKQQQQHRHHKKHSKQHYHSHHHKIKKLRTKPEAGIMQKKLKI